MRIHDINQPEMGHLTYLLALNMMSLSRSATFRKLLEEHKSAKKVFEMVTRRRQVQLPLFTEKEKASPGQLLHMAEKELEYCHRKGISLIPITDKHYPFRLLQCPDAPILLYCRGEYQAPKSHVLAIVGTRKASERGLSICREMVSTFRGLDLTIISGMAHGIDTCAHRAALDNDIHTLAIMGRGFNHIYPSENLRISREIEEKGALFTEFHSSCKYNRGNFPSRNRIIAGMSDAVIVVESKKRGGSLITADIAHSYDRDVFAIPGSPKDELSRGCNWIIKDQKAVMIETADDVIEWMNWEGKRREDQKTMELFSDLDPTELSIVEKIRENGEVHQEDLIDSIDLSFSELSSVILSMELKDIIVSRPGKIYRLKA